MGSEMCIRDSASPAPTTRIRLSSDAPFIMDEIIKGDKAAKEVVAVVFLRNDLLVNFLSKFILITSSNFILL